MRLQAYFFVAAAAVLWGMISIFVRGLASFGFSSWQISAIRVVLGAAILIGYVVITDKKLLKIKLTDIKYFIGTGILSIVFFNWCYFSAITETSVAVAAILLYTAPVFVTVLAVLVFKEKFTLGKGVALATTFVGCALVTGILPQFTGSVSTFGLLTGLGAGICYALYSIFGKLALQKYQPLTVTTYTFICAAVVLLPTGGLWRQAALFTNWQVLAYSIGFSLLATVLAYMLYTVGLARLEPSKAAITATLEPLVAAVVGALVFGESLSGWQYVGMLVILAAVTAVQFTDKGRQDETHS